MSSYNTISDNAEGFLKIKGSKFYAYAKNVSSESEALSYLDEIKSLHPKARHHCYGWRIKLDHEILERHNDDGEPSGTAGKPILGQIVKHDLVNVAVIVVRYFGGTLLGTSGLIQAYKNSCAEAIDAADIVIITVQSYFQIKIDFSLVHILEEWAPKLNLTIDDRKANKTSAEYKLHCDASGLEENLIQLKSKLLNLYLEETPVDKLEFSNFTISIQN
ncbi:IMPACT family protein [Membranihabitans marinus]|uniref:IMPACT family protein n=1 Tax=Membranihabitans marinus TaxID=1227546 RepID=UPI001F17DCC9|nr:YigZ family protein [Membranihabitans marinus]